MCKPKGGVCSQSEGIFDLENFRKFEIGLKIISPRRAKRRGSFDLEIFCQKR